MEDFRMDNAGNAIRGLDEAARERSGLPASRRVGWSQGYAAPALTLVAPETLSMDKVARFFDGIVEPQGNALVSELVDENGPLAGRESARGKRKPGSVAMQFSDGDRPMLFAPNDAPDELPSEPTEAGKLLREQEFRNRRRFSA
jgi:hypothetical protein